MIHKCREHYKKEKPNFCCPKPGCPRRGRSFARKFDLERHLKCFHGGDQRYFCTHSSCKYAEGGSSNGFSRKDNLKEHVKRMHPSPTDPSAISLWTAFDAWSESLNANTRASAGNADGSVLNAMVESTQDEASSLRVNGHCKRARSSTPVASEHVEGKYLREQNEQLQRTVRELEERCERLEEKYKAEQRDHDETRRLLRRV